MQDTIQVDLRIVEHRSYGTVLQYFTGSKEHNVKLRQLALDRGYSLSEYSLTRLSDSQDLFFDREEDVYAALGLPYIPPEMREDRGEIEAALQGQTARPGGAKGCARRSACAQQLVGWQSIHPGDGRCRRGI